MNWNEIKVLTNSNYVESVAAIFHSLGSGGVAIEDWQAARVYNNVNEGDKNLSSFKTVDHDFVVVKAYFHENKAELEEAQKRVKELEEIFGVPFKIFLGTVKDEDWEESWKAYYHTFRVGEKLVIKPSWEEYQAKENDLIIELDPGMAFGTGIHASTRFCLLFLEKYIKGGEFVIDAGCGSGILSIAALRLGARQIFGMDVDELAVKIAKENSEINGYINEVTFETGDIIETIADMQADVIVANITAEVLVYFIPEAVKALKPGGYFFGSGIVDSRWPGVEKQLKAHGLSIEEVLTDVDWVGVAARRM